MASKLARPAYVPRTSGSSPGCRMVKPFTWTSYTTVSCHGVPGGRSFPQSKYGFTTTERGTKGALSALFGFSGSAGPWPYTAGSQRTWPSIALAYGSSSSLAGLQR